MFRNFLGIILPLLPGFVLGFIASIGGALVAHWLSERRRRKEEFNKAAAAFRNSFVPEILRLKYETRIKGAACDNNIPGFLQAGMVDHHMKAFGIFGAYLSKEERCRIDKAWRKYQEDHKSYNDKDTALKEIETFLDTFASLK